MWILGLVVGLSAIYAIYGALVTSPYERRFAGNFPPDEKVDGYLKPREVIDDDEGTVARRVATRIAADSLRRPRHAGRNDAMFHEPHWGHTSGLLRGELVVDRIEALPARFRVGLFAARGTTFHEMRPLGQLFRLRRHAHVAHSGARVSHLYWATPGAMVGSGQFGHA